MKIPTDWTFKSVEIADGFDRHVREQLPWYDLMTGAVAHIARHYITPNSLVYDLGCSTGNIGKAIAETLKSRNARLVAVDNAEEMESLYSGPGNFLCSDIETVLINPFSVAICFLSLMFLTKKSRKELLAKLVAKCEPGGIVIVVDKTESVGGYLGTAISRLTIAAKASTNTPPADIIAKELSLAGVQRPMSESEICGKIIFRFGEFVGYAIENESK
jgi:tRNA (cmo5U34)-methyltransferase